MAEFVSSPTLARAGGFPVLCTQQKPEALGLLRPGGTYEAPCLSAQGG